MVRALAISFMCYCVNLLFCSPQACAESLFFSAEQLGLFYKIEKNQDSVIYSDSNERLLIKTKQCNQLLIENFWMLIKNKLNLAKSVGVTKANLPLLVYKEANKDDFIYLSEHHSAFIHFMQLPNIIKSLSISEQNICLNYIKK